MTPFRRAPIDEKAIERVVAERVDKAVAEAVAGVEARVEALVAERMATALPAAVRQAVPSWIYRRDLRALDFLASTFADDYRDLRVEVGEDGAVVRWLDADGKPTAWRGDLARNLYVSANRALLGDPFQLALARARKELDALGLNNGEEFQRDLARELSKRGRGEVVQTEP